MKEKVYESPIKFMTSIFFSNYPENSWAKVYKILYITAIPPKMTKIGSIRLSLKNGSIQGQMYFLITICLLSCRPNVSMRHKYLGELIKQVEVNFHILCLAVDLRINVQSKKGTKQGTKTKRKQTMKI